MTAASTKKASADDGVASWSRASLRQRPSQPKVRSTTHRRGWTAKPFCPAAAPTMVTATEVAVATRSCRSGRDACDRPRGGPDRSRAGLQRRPRPSALPARRARQPLGLPRVQPVRGRPGSARVPSVRRCPPATGVGTSGGRSARAGTRAGDAATRRLCAARGGSRRGWPAWTSGAVGPSGRARAGTGRQGPTRRPSSWLRSGRGHAQAARGRRVSTWGVSVSVRYSRNARDPRCSPSIDANQTL